MGGRDNRSTRCRVMTNRRDSGKHTDMDAAQDIKSRLDIADLIGEYLPLKPAGAGAFKANCPFHQERTPSFYVSRSRQTWHCFGCDEGGDHFTFVEKMEGMEFREALELLAQKTGVVLPAFDGEKQTQKKRLYEVNDLAVRYFRAALENLPQAEVARAYLLKRGVDPLTADLFKLGYAPDGWTALSDALMKKGVTADELVRAGLCGKKEGGGGVYDRFRHRVMFPIFDVHGNAVGFTGRILSDDKKEAKYVNTPETALYRKSAVLYGLDKAKGEIRQQDLAVIVEGNMDVVSSHQFNVANVVAASGTALTSEQLSLIKRFTTNLSIAFDQDKAGMAATLRGLDLARAQDFNIKIISLPPDAGKDPDEAVRKDPQIWKDAIKNAVSIMEWIYRQAFRDRHSDQPEDKKQIAKDVLPEIKRIVDAVERDHWLKKLAKDLAVSEEALKEAIGKRVASPAPRTNLAPNGAVPSKPIERAHSPQREFERVLFASIIARLELLEAAMGELRVLPSDFGEPDLAALYEKVKQGYSQGEYNRAAGTASGQPIRPPAGLAPDETMLFDALAFLAEREFQDRALDDITRELTHAVDTLRRQRKTRERTRLEQEMREAERVGDQSRIADLLKQFEAMR